MTSVSFDPSGRHLVSGSYDKTVRVWDVQQQSQIKVISAHRDWVFQVRFAPDGKRVVSGAGDGLFCLEVSSGEHVWQAHDQKNVSGLAFTPDGAQVLASSADGTVAMRMLATGELTSMLRVSPSALAQGDAESAF